MWLELAPEPEVYETSIAANPERSGEIWNHGVIKHEPFAHIGDNNIGYYSKGYLSFNIGELHGKTVQDAEINFTNISSIGEPSSFASEIVVKVYNYVRLDASDWAIGGEQLLSIPISAANYTISGNTLKNELQDVLDNEVRNYFQLKLGLNVSTNNDGSSDGINIYFSEVELHISYTD